jgi:hypothetical protein
MFIPPGNFIVLTSLYSSENLLGPVRGHPNAAAVANAKAAPDGSPAARILCGQGGML